MKQGAYVHGRIAVDAVIFTIQEKTLKVLLHIREKEPFRGKKELPGGLLKPSESAEETVERKLAELIGHHDIYIEQFHTFTDPNRDPRERTISIGFIALVNAEKIGLSGNWFVCDKLGELAFDHKKIITEAIWFMKKNANSFIIRQFMPDKFPLNQLQEVYEIIEGTKYDNRNFRKKLITSGIVKETSEREKTVSHRPAKLFRFSD